MILADTSVWIDHLRAGDARMARRLEDGVILTHPSVIGEIALGGLRGREEILGYLARLPRAVVATDVEVLGLIDRHRLSGSGIGYVDAHLLAACRLTGAGLWTRDRRLGAVAARLPGLAIRPGAA